MERGQKGFYSFFIVLAMMVILLALGVQAQNSSLELERARDGMIDMEQANKERTILENNTDRIIAAKLEEQVIRGNFNTESAKGEINSALLGYLLGKAQATDIFYGQAKELTLDYLNQNTGAVILKANGVTYAEYTYTSNLLKSSIVSAKLGKDAAIYFRIPIGHTTKVVR
jgi:Tfp pilus assembly protein PilX